jgi:hypothetical protein
MWLSGVMLLLLLLVSWKCWSLLTTEMSAYFIHVQCNLTQKLFIDNIDNTDKKDVEDGLPNRVEFLVSYYYNHGKSVRKNSRLADLVQQDYCRTLTNAVESYQEATGKDLSGNIQEWTSIYN